MPVVSILFNKGGVGKTTTAVNLAGIAQDPIIVDNDFGASTTYYFGIDPSWCEEANLANVYRGLTSVEDALINIEGGISLLPSTSDLETLDLELIQDQEYLQSISVLRAALDPIRYRNIIIDNPPNGNVVAMNGLVAADTILVPIPIEPQVIKELEPKLRWICDKRDRYNPTAKIKALFTMFEGRYNDSVRLLESAKQLAFRHSIAPVAMPIKRSVTIWRNADNEKPLSFVARDLRKASGQSRRELDRFDLIVEQYKEVWEAVVD